MADKEIYTTRPLLPELASYVEKLEEIWDSQWLSNGGEKHKELERVLKAWLGVQNVSLFNNGTTALMVAIQSLRLQGEVITTPFSFPATAHVLPWNGITPVFCDIEPEGLTIDPSKIESLITARTSAILGVHVYGVPCQVEEIQDIANRHGLKVVYDAAHAFGSLYKDKPLVEYGDISMLSFHATKLFHTGEGGALVYADSNLKQRVEYLKNFGIKNEHEVLLPGINGKMNELQAALGLAVMPLVNEERAKRSVLREIYMDGLNKIPGVRVIEVPSYATNSEQYCCISVDEGVYGLSRDDLYVLLRKEGYLVRKYFHPLISSYPCYSSLPSANPEFLSVASSVSSRVLCLPFYGELAQEEVENIVCLIKRFKE